MSMSIGQMMRGLVGDAQAGDVRALELKAGQKVRAVLVKMTGDQEGIVQINGVPVHAKLDTPLEPGKAVLLQVQPEPADGALVLKQAEPEAGRAPEASVKAWIQALELPDTKASAALVAELRKNGLALTPGVASQFKAALAAMPAGGDALSWLRAAALAFKRGLPMTGATIGALQQVLAGPPAHALLDALEAGLAAWRGTAAEPGAAAGTAPPPAGAAQAAAAKLQALLAEGAALMREAHGAGGAAPPAWAGAAGHAGPGAKPGPRGEAPAGAAGGAAARSGGAAAEAGAGAGSPPPKASELSRAADAGTAHGSTARSSVEGMPHEQRLAREQAAALRSGAADVRLGVLSDSASSPAAGGPYAGTNANSAQSTSSASGSSWVGQLMKWMGVDHERLLATSTIRSTPASPMSATSSQVHPLAGEARHGSADAASLAARAAIQERLTTSIGPVHGFSVPQRFAPLLAAPPAGMPLPDLTGSAAGDSGKLGSSESLKSALMTLAAANDVSPSIRDAAQQLVAHITGQQLLMTPETNGALFSHVTLFVPMKGPDGSQTASVHIQTRRGRKGELDGDNCRLLFDLRMHTLGDTVVDVQVVDRIVNLQLWNDHPSAAGLLESTRGELDDALAKAGYALLTLRAEPMPERIAERMNGQDGTKATADSLEWSAKPYKGVDMRA